MKILSVVVLCCLLVFDNEQASTTFQTSQDSMTNYVDTTMLFANLKPSTAAKIDPLTEVIVKQKLYKYYKERDYVIEPLSKADSDKNTVRYNLSRFSNLNQDKFSDAIVEYWLLPPGGNGHCFQPHKAMIVSGAKGYVFINPDFVNSFFSIDSVRSSDDGTFIYGCDYDCGGTEKCKRKVRVRIQ